MGSTLNQSAFRVYLSAPNQSVNHGTDQVSFLTPLEISRTSGGRQLDYAVFDWNIGMTGQHVENLKTPLDWAREVEVWGTLNGQNVPVFWGDLTTQDIEVSRSERVTVTAKLMPYHFGPIAEGVSMFNNITTPATVVRVRGDIEFNPMVDGERIKNRSGKKLDSTTQLQTHHAWLDPESVMSDPAQAFNNSVSWEYWELKEAILALCWEFNYEEEFVKNPNLSDDTLFEDAPEIRNVSMPRGRYLPDYLDALLLPLGYDWYVELSSDPQSNIQRQIKIFRRTEGEEKELKLAARGDPADFATTDTDRVAVITDIGATINKIVAHGAVQRREITVELVRGWAAAQDSLTLAELSYSQDGILDHPAVWRRFVANEAGDYINLRTAYTAPLDLSSVFDDYFPRRRKFMRPLTKTDDDQPMEVYVEYYNGTSWNPLPDAHVGEVKILQTEMGIFFAGATPPQTLYDIGDDLKIRVTGTVVGDKPLTYEAEDTTESPNARPNTLFLNLRDSFVDNQVHQTGTYASILYTEKSLTKSFAQRDGIETYVDALLEVEKSAVLKCDFSLMGLNANYKIGQLITKVAGREIDLNRKTELAENPRYPQIIGVVFNPQQNQTRLLVDTNEGL